LNWILSFLGEGKFQGEIFRDGINADKVAIDYRREIIDIPVDNKLKYQWHQEVDSL